MRQRGRERDREGERERERERQAGLLVGGFLAVSGGFWWFLGIRWWQYFMEGHARAQTKVSW